MKKSHTESALEAFSLGVRRNMGQQNRSGQSHIAFSMKSVFVLVMIDYSREIKSEAVS